MSALAETWHPGTTSGWIAERGAKLISARSGLHAGTIQSTSGVSHPLIQRLALAIRAAEEHEFDLPTEEEEVRFRRFLTHLSRRLPEVADNVEISIAPDGTIGVYVDEGQRMLALEWPSGNRGLDLSITGNNEIHLTELTWREALDQIERNW